MSTICKEFFCDYLPFSHLNIGFRLVRYVYLVMLRSIIRLLLCPKLSFDVFSIGARYNFFLSFGECNEFIGVLDSDCFYGKENSLGSSARSSFESFILLSYLISFDFGSFDLCSVSEFSLITFFNYEALPE